MAFPVMELPDQPARLEDDDDVPAHQQRLAAILATGRPQSSEEQASIGASPALDETTSTPHGDDVDGDASHTLAAPRPAGDASDRLSGKTAVTATPATDSSSASSSTVGVAETDVVPPLPTSSTSRPWRYVPQAGADADSRSAPASVQFLLTPQDQARLAALDDSAKFLHSISEKLNEQLQEHQRLLGDLDDDLDEAAGGMETFSQQARDAVRNPGEHGLLLCATILALVALVLLLYFFLFRE